MGAKKTARSKEETLKPQLEQGELFSKIVHPAIKQLEAIDPDNLSPRQAMEALYLLKNLINKTPE
jgi:hypothetical protein